jgi:hypothetical protein
MADGRWLLASIDGEKGKRKEDGVGVAINLYFPQIGVDRGITG